MFDNFRAKARIKKQKEEKHFAAQKSVMAQDIQKRLRVSYTLLYKCHVNVYSKQLPFQ